MKRFAPILLAFAALGAQAQYPTKPIRLVVPFAPGGSSSIIARAFSVEMSKGLGQQFVVENKPGGGGNIAMQEVARAEPDGYTLIIGHIGTFAVNPFMFAKLPFDTNRDFRAVSLFAKVPQIFVVPSSVPAKDLREFVALAKKDPGKLYYGSAGNGSAGHMAGELLKSQAHVSAVHIPYAGAAPAQLGLLAGKTDFMFDNMASALPQIKAGKLMALAVTTPQRAPALPDAPTMAQSGLAGFDVSTWFGVFVPTGTPPAIVARLNETMTAALRTPEMKERLARMGAEPAPMSSQQFAELVRSELAKYEKLVKFSGARVD